MGSKVRFNVEKSSAVNLMGNLSPIPKALAIGTSILGLLSWAMVEPSWYVTIE